MFLPRAFEGLQHVSTKAPRLLACSCSFQGPLRASSTSPRRPRACWPAVAGSLVLPGGSGEGGKRSERQLAVRLPSSIGDACRKAFTLTRFTPTTTTTTTTSTGTHAHHHKHKHACPTRPPWRPCQAFTHSHHPPPQAQAHTPCTGSPRPLLQCHCHPPAPSQAQAHSPPAWRSSTPASRWTSSIPRPARFVGK